MDFSDNVGSVSPGIFPFPGSFLQNLKSMEHCSPRDVEKNFPDLEISIN